MQSDKIILEPLTAADAAFMFSLYTNASVATEYTEAPFADGESAINFTNRLIDFCEAVFTIRTNASPGTPIGDCALHHLNAETKEMEIGGSLLPEHWGKGYMQEAFYLLAKIARDRFGAHVLIGNTEKTNHKAARLVEKMGFEKYQVE
ncbi:MAG: N-acetyltransferase [Sphingobacteriales bacterium]|nr:MAG: N-acetyltransferase [Sphingobacteriales bacterium]